MSPSRWFGPADFNGAIQRSARRNLRDGTRDIVSSNRLDQHGRHANGVAVRGNKRQHSGPAKTGPLTLVTHPPARRLVAASSPRD
jgi:hypothetical protein